MFSRIQIGSVVPVKVDPGNPLKVAVDMGALASMPMGGGFGGQGTPGAGGFGGQGTPQPGSGGQPTCPYCRQIVPPGSTACPYCQGQLV